MWKYWEQWGPLAVQEGKSLGTIQKFPEVTLHSQAAWAVVFGNPTEILWVWKTKLVF